jgi:hypothetical protein
MMALATNLVGPVNPHSSDPGKPRIGEQSGSFSYVSDFAWRLTHAIGEMLALLWGVGALGAVGLLVAGIFG